MQYQEWWEANKQDACRLIHTTVKALQDDDAERREDNLIFLRMYGGTQINESNSRLQFCRPRPRKAKLSFNLVYSMVDTVCNKFSKIRPYPTFLTSGGDYRLRKKGKDLNKFTRGAFYSTKIYEKFPLVVRDGCIFGDGYLKIYREGKEIFCRRELVDEFSVDFAEASTMNPQTFHQSRYVNKFWLMKQHPKYKVEIELAANETDAIAVSHTKEISNLVEVHESWKLASGLKDEKGNNKPDGRHCLSIKNTILIDEPYNKTYFPFVKFSWSDPTVGWNGQGLAEQLMPLQYELNRLLDTIQRSHALLAIPRIFYEVGTKFNPKIFTNEVGSFVPYSGKAPSVMTFQAMHPEIYNQVDRIFTRAFELAGISQLGASAKKPAGLDSGVALREFQDIESERFVSVQQRIEECYMEAARQMIELAREIKEEYGEFETISVGKGTIEKIDWKNINLKETEYVMQVFPTSSLPQHPAGRLQRIKEMVEAGLLPLEEARALLDFPDLEATTNRLNANLNLCEKIIDNMLYTPLKDENDKEIDVKEEKDLDPDVIAGQLYIAPEPYQKLDFCLAIFQDAYLTAKLDGVPDTRLDLLRRWMDTADEMLALAEQSAQPVQPNPTEALPMEQVPVV